MVCMWCVPRLLIPAIFAVSSVAASLAPLVAVVLGHVENVSPAWPRDLLDEAPQRIEGAQRSRQASLKGGSLRRVGVRLADGVAKRAVDSTNRLPQLPIGFAIPCAPKFFCRLP